MAIPSSSYLLFPFLFFLSFICSAFSDQLSSSFASTQVKFWFENVVNKMPAAISTKLSPLSKQDSDYYSKAISLNNFKADTKFCSLAKLACSTTTIESKKGVLNQAKVYDEFKKVTEPNQAKVYDGVKTEPNQAKVYDEILKSTKPNQAKVYDEFKKGTGPNQAKVYDEIFNKGTIPNQAKVYDEIVKKGTEPNQAKVYDEIFNKDTEPNQAKVYDEFKKFSEPNQAKVYDEFKKGTEPNQAKVYDDILTGTKPNQAKVYDEFKKSVDPKQAKVYHEILKGTEPNQAKVYDAFKKGTKPNQAKVYDEIFKKSTEPSQAKVYDEFKKRTVPNIVRISYSAATPLEKSDPFLFFRLSILQQGNTIHLSNLKETLPFRTFLPPQIASKISLIPKSITNIFPESKEAMETTLSHCNSLAIKGELKACPKSLEEMISFSKTALGTSKLLSLTSKSTAGSGQELTIKTIKHYDVEKIVACHEMFLPFATYFCHTLLSSRIYSVDLVDPKTGAPVNTAVAICHMDTSSWSENHVAFKMLKFGPGQGEACHWMNEIDLAWINGGGKL